MYTKLANKGNYNTKKRSLSVIRYIVVHYTANNGDTARNNLNYYAGTVVQASAHYYVDETEVCCSVLPEYAAWSVGGKPNGWVAHHPLYQICTNANSLNVELCSRKDSGGKYYIAEATAARGAAFVRQLMDAYGIPLDRVVRHYDVTGKYCPQPYVDEGEWLKFKARLTPEGEEEMKLYHWFADMPDWARPSAEKAYQKGLLSVAENGAVNVYEDNLQTLVWMDRLGLLE